MLVVEIILVVALVVSILAYRLAQLSAQKLILVVIGALLGSLIGSLLAIPLSALSEPYKQYLPITITVVLSVALAVVFYSKHDFLDNLIPKKSVKNPKHDKLKPLKINKNDSRILVDTSAIIDGRIGDIVASGFIPGTLIVPRFVLAELQNIADSEDPLRRGRGRRGLEILNELRLNDGLELEIIEDDPVAVKEVDHKLVYLAKKHRASILTTDYNLNRVATIEGVKILNINELANAIRAVVLPGEIMSVNVVQSGKEKGQGVGYLPDGTMIVVDGGDKLIGKDVECEVTRIFQTVAGKMIFATPKNSKPKIAKAKKPHSYNRHQKKT
ncbi:TRAM domain-containing protein [Candidatus Saccharibacteria bacterium]|nr:TRAM domain-containing protein [Candidatus Saccharibacteria bacterium]